MKLWIARDKDGDLYLYNRLPSLDYYGISFDADSDEYLTFRRRFILRNNILKNSPQQVEIKLIKEE